MAALDLKHHTIAVLPGTSNMGSHLSFQLAKKDLSWDLRTQPKSVKGVSNAEAAITSDIIIWCPAVTYKSLPPNLLLDSSVQVQFHKFQIREFE
jgi:hypothetical protein